MNEKAIIRLVRSATLKINYAGHTILIDPVFADKGTLQSALGVYKNPRVHLVILFCVLPIFRLRKSTRQ